MEGAVVVTGSSRGIGAATARLAASRGYAVAVTYRADRAGAEEVAAEIGGDAVALQALRSAAARRSGGWPLGTAARAVRS